MKPHRVYLILIIISIIAFGYALREESLSPQPFADKIFITFLGISANIIQLVAFVKEEISNNKLSESLVELVKQGKKEEISKMSPDQLIEHLLVEYKKQNEKKESIEPAKRFWFSNTFYGFIIIACSLIIVLSLLITNILHDSVSIFNMALWDSSSIVTASIGVLIIKNEANKKTVRITLF